MNVSGVVDAAHATANATRLVAGKDVFPSNPYLQICVSLSNLLCFVIIMIMSHKINRSDLSRLYTLWLFCAQAPSDLIQIVICILQLNGLVDYSGNYYRDTIDYIQMTGKLFGDMAGIVYRILALQMVIATFMSYVFPFSFARIFHASRRSRLYLCGFIFVIVQAFNNNIHTVITVALGPTRLPEDLITVWYLTSQFFVLFPGFLLMIFYFLSIIVIIRYTNKNPGGRADSKSQHRRQLLAVIIYATTPNVLVVFQMFSNAFSIAVSSLPIEVRTPDHPVIVTGGMFNKMTRYGNYGRVPILLMSTCVAFAGYRRFVLSLIPCRATVIQVQSMNTTSKTQSVQ
ncbi:hypothetical protein L596_013438 [Steinernema carpocapsae]|uniref:G-protein coupled receptors family 1 profile domain-containing protein n=1 Tax=Steinernema carpocapsae TaxID=34508 RepID=A0A4U5P0A5_STECR|nr:hypothetical protein L596_013438 [Steinernema carpocapsae]